MRVIVFWDHEPLGALPNVTDVLDNASVISPYNHDKVTMQGVKNRFSILRDISIPVALGAGTVVTTEVPFTIHIKNLKGTTVYQSDAGTISDLLKGALEVLVIGSEGVANCYYQAMYCFTDI